LKQKIPLNKISEISGVSVAELFDMIKRNYKLVLKEPEKIYKLKKSSIVYTSYSFKTMGFPAEDITGDFRSLMTKSHWYSRQKIFLDNLQDFDFRKKNKVFKLFDLKKPIIISYVIPNNKKIPKDFSKRFKIIDLTVKSEDIKDWLDKNYPDFKGNIDKIYKKCNKDINLTLNNILNSELSDDIITREFTINNLATAILNSEDRNFVYTMMHYLDMPYFFVISWIRQMAPIAYKENLMDVLRTLEFVDLNKFKLDREFIMSILAYRIPKADRVIMPHFPRLTPKIKKKEKKEEKIKVKKGKIKKKIKQKGFEF
jgi:hypothetical protein